MGKTQLTRLALVGVMLAGIAAFWYFDLASLLNFEALRGAATIC
jgi:hypothetical protein